MMNQNDCKIDRRSICIYDDTLNLMRYNNHFITDIKAGIVRCG